MKQKYVLASAISACVMALMIGAMVNRCQKDRIDLANIPPLVKGLCYVFTDHLTYGFKHYMVYKILQVGEHNSYLDTTWTFDAGWSPRSNITYHTSLFFSEVKCPNERIRLDETKARTSKRKELPQRRDHKARPGSKAHR